MRLYREHKFIVRALPILTVGLLASSPAWAGSATEKLEALLTKGKPDKVLAKVDKAIAKEDSRLAINDLLDLKARAWHELLVLEPSMVGCQLFLDEFTDHDLTPVVRELEAGLALGHAASCDNEGVYRGIARQYPDTPAAREMLELAEASSFAAVSQSQRSDALRGHVLRYPQGEHVEQARLLELDRAFSEADAAGASTAWLLLLDRYPDHPRLDDATAKLEEISWAELQGGSPSVEGLWRYAADHSDTDNGWKAATAALEEALVASLPGGTELERGTATVGVVLSGLDLDVGAPPPPGYELEVLLQAKVGADAVWTPWSEAVLALAPRLGLDPASLEGIVVDDVVLSGSSVQWRTPLPLCSASEQPLEARAWITLRRGDREQSWEQGLSVQGACPGARHLVFSQQGDDLEGPLGLFVFEPSAGVWRAQRGLEQVRSSWDCSHIESVDSYGASVVCGAITKRIGFEPDHVWIRRTDPEARSSKRVELLSMESLGGSPWKLERPRRGGPVIKDEQGVEIAKPGDRLPMITPAVPSLAFGHHPDGNIPTPPIASAEEDAEADGGPLPVGAMLVDLPRAKVSPDEQKHIAALFSQSSGRELELREASLLGPLPGHAHVSTPLYDVLMRDRKNSRWSERVLMARLTSGPYGWFQVIEPPSDAAWRAFAYKENLLYRAVQQSSTRAVMHTLRHDGTAWVLDQGTIDAEGVVVADAAAGLGRMATRSSDAIVLGALDKSLIDAVVDRHQNQVLACYSAGLQGNPGLAGEVVIKFVIAKDGAVTSAATKSSTLHSPPVEQCLNDQASRWQFPMPKGGGIVIVSYPFVFEP